MVNNHGEVSHQKIRSRRCPIALLPFMVAALWCAQPAMARDKGGEAYNAGNYATAASEWSAASRRGDMRAAYNLGVMYENGIGPFSRDTNQAMVWYLRGAQGGDFSSMVALARNQIAIGQTEAGLSWLNLAARWNYADAATMLRNMNRPVPSPDLYLAQQQAAGQVGFTLGCMIAGGCYSAPPALGQSVPYQPRQTLKREWFSAGADQMCEYEDGTVLNMDNKSCPSSIGGN